ncbi:MAG: hypothetical protein ACLQFR_04740 [Streptosporangiaceae bacterium]
MTASATAPASSVLVPDLRLTDANNGAPVRWDISNAYAKQLTVTGAGQGTAQIILPLARSYCPSIAAELKVTCSGNGELSLPSPVSFGWSDQELVSSTNGEAGSAASSVEIEETVTSPGGPELDISPDMRAYPSLCFDSPQRPSKLTISSGSNSYRHSFTGTEPSLPCTGVSILVGLGGGAPPVLQLAGVGGLAFMASAQSATLQGFAGQLALDPGGTTVSNGPGAVIVCSKNAACPLTATVGIGQVSQSPDACPLATTTGIGQASQSLAVCSTAATSVITKNGQLVPSAWARQTEIFAPLLGGIVSALVVGPLTVFMQLLMDALKNWRGPNYRRGKKAGNGRENQGKEVGDAA